MAETNLTQTVIDIIKGIGCETCAEERTFGHPPDNSPENLYLYNDLSGTTRCFCKKHMTYFTDKGALLHFDEKTDSDKPGYGALLMSDVLSGKKYLG